MKRKGFTLVELLAVIVIMGVILVVVVPSINKLQNQNKKEGYTTYAESTLRAAKIYLEDQKLAFTRKYNWTTNCYIPITYAQLIDANLIKPYNDKRYNCTHLEIRVYKEMNETMTFKYQLICYDTKAGNKEVYKKSTFKGGINACASRS